MQLKVQIMVQAEVLPIRRSLAACVYGYRMHMQSAISHQSGGVRQCLSWSFPCSQTLVNAPRSGNHVQGWK